VGRLLRLTSSIQSERSRNQCQNTLPILVYLPFVTKTQEAHPPNLPVSSSTTGICLDQNTSHRAHLLEGARIRILTANFWTQITRRWHYNIEIGIRRPWRRVSTLEQIFDEPGTLHDRPESSIVVVTPEYSEQSMRSIVDAPPTVNTSDAATPMCQKILLHLLPIDGYDIAEAYYTNFEWTICCRTSICGDENSNTYYLFYDKKKVSILSPVTYRTAWCLSEDEAATYMKPALLLPKFL